VKGEIRHDEYVRKLLEERKREVIKTDAINQRNLLNGEGLTSPTSNMTTEETRLLREYMEQKNLLKISEAAPSLKKSLNLRKFFKMKRNQQVEVYSFHGEELKYTEGKVSAVGRNFVMLTDLKDRIWIPYEKIDSANIPYGIPNYSNTHQHFIYDNNLREKLLYDFGATVSKRDTLMQQFNEDTLHTNLERWKGSWVEVYFGKDEKRAGELIKAAKQTITLKVWKKEFKIDLNEVNYVHSIRFFNMVKQLIKKGY
jgi:ribosome maturation factor RimP